MNEVYELIDRFVTAKSKEILLSNQIKDLNNKSKKSELETIKSSIEELCTDFFKKIQDMLSTLNTEDIDKIIDVLKIEGKNYSKSNYKYNNYEYYRVDACNYLINYLNEYKSQIISKQI